MREIEPKPAKLLMLASITQFTTPMMAPRWSASRHHALTALSAPPFSIAGAVRAIMPLRGVYDHDET